MSVKVNGQNVEKQCKIQEDSATPRLVNGINMDLLGDLSEFCEQYLEEIGVERKDGSDAIVDYFQIDERIIKKCPRQIFKAKNFSCPSGYEKKLAYLESCIKTGKDLNPFLSRNLKNLQCEDLMQLDWNIRHFHISDQLDAEKNDGFMERSDYLLMAYVTEGAVYFITAVPHGKEGSELWADVDYVQIIKDNWPEILEKYWAKGKFSSIHISNKERFILRKKRVNAVTELADDYGYMNIYGGCLANGTSMYAYLRTIRLKRQITDLEKLMSADKLWVMLRHDQEICPRLRAVKTPSLKLILPIGVNNFTLKEPQLKVLFAASWHDRRWILNWIPYQGEIQETKMFVAKK